MRFRQALLLFLVVAVSCTKPAEKKKLVSSGNLYGKWEYTEHYFSIGGPGAWQPVLPSGQMIEFMPLGLFRSAASFSGTFRNHEVVDSVTVKFTPTTIASGYVLMRYQIDEAQGTLLLSPIEPMCIEGCLYKLRRTSN